MFWQKKDESSNKNAFGTAEYDGILKRLSELRAEINNLSSDVKTLQTDLDNLRGNFNRKLRGIKEEEQKAEKKEEEQKDINGGYIPFG